MDKHSDPLLLLCKLTAWNWLRARLRQSLGINENSYDSTKMPRVTSLLGWLPPPPIFSFHLPCARHLTSQHISLFTYSVVGSSATKSLLGYSGHDNHNILILICQIPIPKPENPLQMKDNQTITSLLIFSDRLCYRYKACHHQILKNEVACKKATGNRNSHVRRNSSRKSHSGSCVNSRDC